MIRRMMMILAAAAMLIATEVDAECCSTAASPWGPGNGTTAQAQTNKRLQGHPAYQGGNSAQDRAVQGRTEAERAKGGLHARQ